MGHWDGLSPLGFGVLFELLRVGLGVWYFDVEVGQFRCVSVAMLIKMFVYSAGQCPVTDIDGAETYCDVILIDGVLLSDDVVMRTLCGKGKVYMR